jgi:hypothetical protein
MEVTDSLIFEKGTKTIGWTMMTQADAQLMPGGAMLKQDGKSVILKILEPANADFSIISLGLPPLEYDKKIKNLKKLEIRIPAWKWKEGKGVIKVQILNSKD